jgi:hypothetical protein
MIGINQKVQVSDRWNNVWRDLADIQGLSVGPNDDYIVAYSETNQSITLLKKTGSICDKTLQVLATDGSC